MIYLFQTDNTSREFCDNIVKAMELLYDIDPNIGCELLNRKWFGNDWRARSNGGTAELPELLYHETEREWAERIGNPCPYKEGIEFDQWKARQNEAEHRIEEYRKTGIHEWLYQ